MDYHLPREEEKRSQRWWNRIIKKKGWNHEKEGSGAAVASAAPLPLINQLIINLVIKKASRWAQCRLEP
jgi:hypothetical protein